MEVFRISRSEYANSLSSSGSANRWNKKEQHVIYTGSSRSLSTLELVVHMGSINPQVDFKMMVISIADDDHLMKQIRTSELPDDWRKFSAYSTLQEIGSKWYLSMESLILKVPSAIIPYEHNYIINVKHPEFTHKVKWVRCEDYFWDERLF